MKPMQGMKHFNRGAILTVITVGLSALQSVLLHLEVTDFVHSYFSVYFFIEIFILLLAIATGLRTKISIVVFLFAFMFEVVWFFNYERPISPDVLLMLTIGIIRIYIFVWLLKPKAKVIKFFK